MFGGMCGGMLGGMCGGILGGSSGIGLKRSSNSGKVLGNMFCPVPGMSGIPPGAGTGA